MQPLTVNKTKVKNYLYQFLADSIFFFHILVVVILLVGWVFPSFHTIYFVTLYTTLISEIILGYCILTRWEFNYRKKIDANLSYDYSFFVYYGHKYLQKKFSTNFVKFAARCFLWSSVIVHFTLYILEAH